jgi:tetratricopeptide (TPR) repeat protein
MFRRRLTAVLVLAVVAIASAPLGAAQTASPLPPAYLSALASYRAGDLSSAFLKLEEVDKAELAGIARALLRRDVAAGSSWPRLLTAAILLHTEAFLIHAEAGPAPPTDPYLSSAHSLVRGLLRLAEDGERSFGETERSFVRDWYLLLVAVEHGRAEIGWSRAYLTEALKSFPNDLNLTLALGSDHEMLSDVSAGSINYFDSSGRFLRQSEVDADGELRDAIRVFEHVTAAAPRMPEARLRLGRLLYRRGDLDRAAQELDAALPLARQAGPPDLVYLALLFRGMVETARGNYDRAGMFYSEARVLLPLAQTAALAQAEAAYLRGRVAEAAATMQGALQQTEKDDPWWAYISGEWWHLEGRLEAIRKYVQQ